MADLKREISILSILKVVIVLVVTTGQGAIEYILYYSSLQKNRGFYICQIFILGRCNMRDTALLKASQNCDETHVVSFLLENGANVDDRDLIDQTPLIVASQHGCKAIVELLLKAGSNIKHKNQQGETALLSAAQEGHIEVVKVLIAAGADANEPNSDGETPLQLAIKLRHKKELVDLLSKLNLRMNP
jgi:ankyrin repeat protein